MIAAAIGILLLTPVTVLAEDKWESKNGGRYRVKEDGTYYAGEDGKIYVNGWFVIEGTYRCASLTDVYWVRYKGERVKFDEINLYDNHLSNTFMDIALRGRQYTVQNEYLARDLSTNGCFPKAWQRSDHRFRLLKDGGEDAVNREILASSISDNITSKAFSIASAEAFNIYVLNHDRDLKKCILSLDSHNYYMMNIMDYLTGNTSCEASQADGF